MAIAINKSTTTPVYGTVWQGPPQKTPQPAWKLDPGKTFASSNPNHTPAYWYFFEHDASVPNQEPFYSGYIRSDYEVDVYPETKSVKIVGQFLDQADLDAFKALYPNDPKIQAVTLEELRKRYKPDEYRGYNVPPPSADQNVRRKRGVITDCEYAIGAVVVDSIFVLTGAIGLHGKIPAAAIEEVAELCKPVMNELEHAVHTLSTASSSWDKAMAIKDIVHVVWSGSLIEAVYKAIMDSLTWWDMVLYGSLGMATIAAAFLTDGAALVAMIAAEMAQIGFVVSDAVKASQACGGN